ncbi:MAG: nucleoside-diphosphate kinase [Acidobacteria bacterium]|nr:nucleoside-diphosphate kinase [Acidobacteriota bacterium]
MSDLTFGIIKPDAVAANNSGKIIQRVLDSGFKVRGLKMLHLSDKQAEGFYAVHRERPFFRSLVEFMTNGPVVVMALEKENAVTEWRALMGPTNSKEAPAGTLRGDFGTDIERNAVHGSDSKENAAIEVSYFFNRLELV